MTRRYVRQYYYWALDGGIYLFFIYKSIKVWVCNKARYESFTCTIIKYYHLITFLEIWNQFIDQHYVQNRCVFWHVSRVILHLHKLLDFLIAFHIFWKTVVIIWIKCIILKPLEPEMYNVLFLMLWNYLWYTPNVLCLYPIQFYPNDSLTKITKNSPEHIL